MGSGRYMLLNGSVFKGGAIQLAKIGGRKNPDTAASPAKGLFLYPIPTQHMLLRCYANQPCPTVFHEHEPRRRDQPVVCLRKILLVVEIWDQVAASFDSLTVPEAHKAELDRRSAADADDAGLPWSEIRAELLCR